jgi:hypothetical protein
MSFCSVATNVAISFTFDAKTLFDRKFMKKEEEFGKRNECYDTQNNDTRLSNTQHNDTWPNNPQNTLSTRKFETMALTITV